MLDDKDVFAPPYRIPFYAHWFREQLLEKRKRLWMRVKWAKPVLQGPEGRVIDRELVNLGLLLEESTTPP